jgi:hypothetical protein
MSIAGVGIEQLSIVLSTLTVPTKLGEYRGYRILPTDGKFSPGIVTLRHLLIVSNGLRHYAFHQQSVE